MAAGTCEPLVSIIVNNFNYARYIGYAIDSALAQTYPHIEVLVVDDGSTDDSRAAIARYTDRVQTIFKANGGQASTINVGAAQARGELVIFLDADDVLLPKTVEAVVAAYCRQPELAKVAYPMAVIDADGKLTGELKPAPHTPRPSGDLRRYELACPFDTPWMSMSGNAFSARVLAKILPMPEDAYRPTGADWYVAHLCTLFGPVVFLDQVGGYYRVHGNNAFASHVLQPKGLRHAIDRMRVTTEHLERAARELGLLPRGQPQEILSCAYITLRMMSLRLDPAQHPIPGESRRGLLRLGVVALRRRPGVTLAFKAALLCWMIGMAVAPQPVARWLAERMLAPATRPDWMNHLLGLGQRPMATASAAPGQSFGA